MEKADIRITRTSSLFETAPMYVLDQQPFINGVCEVGWLKLFFFSIDPYVPPFNALFVGRDHLKSHGAIRYSSISRD
jgi:hypothetical protein